MKKLTFVLVLFVLLTGAMCVASSNYSVLRTREAIAAIGDVRYNDEALAALDRADSYYDSMDARLSLVGTLSSEDEVRLIDAKSEYVRLAIKAATTADKRKVADDLTDDDVRALVQAARDKADEYLTTTQQHHIENYDALEELEQAYAQAATAAPAEEKEEVQLC